MHKVIWRKSAEDDVAQITHYTNIERGHVQAGKLIEICEQATNFLAESPKMGRQVRRNNVYVFTLTKVPFVILYEINGSDIFINQVIHMRKRR